MKASIGINGYLELGGRQAMLLARLMDEFPPPEPTGVANASTPAPAGPTNVMQEPEMKAVSYHDDNHATSSINNDICTQAAERHGNSGHAL